MLFYHVPTQEVKLTNPFIAIIDRAGGIRYNEIMNNEMNELWVLCRLLGNPIRLKMVCLAARSKKGINVSETAKALSLGESAVSIYLKQLANTGILLRWRTGINVDYLAAPFDGDTHVIPRRVLSIIRENCSTLHDIQEMARYFNALGNDTRISAIGALRSGRCDDETLAERVMKPVKTLIRQMHLLLEAKIVGLDEEGFYHLLPARDALHAAILTVLP